MSTRNPRSKLYAVPGGRPGSTAVMVRTSKQVRHGQTVMSEFQLPSGDTVFLVVRPNGNKKPKK